MLAACLDVVPDSLVDVAEAKRSGYPLAGEELRRLQCIALSRTGPLGSTRGQLLSRGQNVQFQVADDCGTPRPCQGFLPGPLDEAQELVEMAAPVRGRTNAAGSDASRPRPEGYDVHAVGIP